MSGRFNKDQGGSSIVGTVLHLVFCRYCGKTEPRVLRCIGNDIVVLRALTQVELGSFIKRFFCFQLSHICDL